LTQELQLKSQHNTNVQKKYIAKFDKIVKQIKNSRSKQQKQGNFIPILHKRLTAIPSKMTSSSKALKVKNAACKRAALQERLEKGTSPVVDTELANNQERVQSAFTDAKGAREKIEEPNK
jgi:hypothetical protein